MTKHQTQIAIQDELQVDLIIHNCSADLLSEFVKQIVKPYFKGNTTTAIQTLMEKALAEETMFSQAVKQ